jgi:hypothetical protein
VKIVAWNLKNLGSSKLRNLFNPVITAAGLGNDVGDYIVGVVMGRAVWNNVVSAALPDLFVVVELVSGGTAKGTAASGTALPTLAWIVGAMNAEANAGFVAPNTNANYQYASVPCQVIGHHETVGIVYNTRALTYVNSGVVRDDVNNRYFLPRTLFRAEFTDVAAGTNLNVVGLHAPKPSGTAPNKYRDGIQYANGLTRSTVLDVANQMLPIDTFVMGDFNCDPTYTYGNPAVAFAMAGYATTLAPVTYSSMRGTIAATNPQPTNYLSDAFDNLLHAFSNGVPVGGAATSVPDLIGGAPLYPGSLLMLFNNYWRVSDHLPVVFEY